MRQREIFQGLNTRDIINPQFIYDCENVLFDSNIIPRIGKYKTLYHNEGFDEYQDSFGDFDGVLGEDVFFGQKPIRAYRYSLLRSNQIADIIFTRDFVFAVKHIGYNSYDVTCLNEKSEYDGATIDGNNVIFDTIDVPSYSAISSFVALGISSKFHRVNDVVDATTVECFDIDSGWDGETTTATLYQSIGLYDNISIVEYINESLFEKTIIFCCNSGYSSPNDGILFQIMPDLTIRRLETENDANYVPKAKYIENYNNQLICGGILDGLIEYPTTIAYSDVANELEWGIGSAGKIDLISSDGEITGISILNSRMYAFKENNISVLTQTGLSDNPFNLDEAYIKEGGFSPCSIKNNIYFYNDQYGIARFDGSSVDKIGYRVEGLARDKYSEGFYVVSAEEGYVHFCNRNDKWYSYKQSVGNLAYNHDFMAWSMYDKHGLDNFDIFICDSNYEALVINNNTPSVSYERLNDEYRDVYDDGNSIITSDYYCYFTTRDDYDDRKSDKRVLEIQLTGAQVFDYIIANSMPTSSSVGWNAVVGLSMREMVAFAPQYVGQLIYVAYRFYPYVLGYEVPNISKVIEMVDTIQQDNYR